MSQAADLSVNSRWALKVLHLIYAQPASEGALLPPPLLDLTLASYLHQTSKQFELVLLEEWYRNFSHFMSKYDSVQIPLFYLFIKQHLTAHQTNAIAKECELLEREGRTVLVQELERVYRLAVLATQAATSVQLPPAWG